MPCSDGYDNEQTVEAKRVATLYINACHCLEIDGFDISVPKRIRTISRYDPRVSSGDDYGWATQELCDLFKSLNQKVKEQLCYGDARDPMRRKLADWYEEHRAEDIAREELANAKQRELEKAERAELKRLTKKYGVPK